MGHQLDSTCTAPTEHARQDHIQHERLVVARRGVRQPRGAVEAQLEDDVVVFVVEASGGDRRGAAAVSAHAAAVARVGGHLDVAAHTLTRLKSKGLN
jgi:hypothetical protein